MSRTPCGFSEPFALIRSSTRAALSALGRSRAHAVASVTLAGGYGAQLAFQMVYFLILTRMLGPDLFGRFAAALAAINLVSPLAGIGFGEVALVRVSQDSEKTWSWAVSAMAITAALGSVLAVCLAMLSGALASDQWLGWHLMLGLALSELVLVRCCAVIAQVHQARREILRTSTINVAVAAVKAVIALSLFLLGQKSLLILVLLLDVCLTPVLVLLFVSLSRRVPTSSISWAQLGNDLRLGVSFAASVACKAAYTDLDKLFLARWSSSYVVGTYAAGYKILSLSFMPIRAILQATFPRQIQLADRDPKACVNFTTSIFFLNIVLACGIASVIYLLAPWATYVLGDDFRNSIAVLRLGFLLPVVQAIHYTLGTYLTAIGHQAVRTIIQVLVLSIYIVAGLIVIPLYSWKGAIVTSLVCETLLAALFGLTCLVHLLRHKGEFDLRSEQRTNE